MLYSSWRFYHDNVLCKPKIGSQGYDATIWRTNKPNQVHTVEVTWPQDGKKHKAVADLMNANGFHGCFGDDFEQYNQEIIERILKTAKKKPVRDYRSAGGSALLIVLDTKCSPLDELERLRKIENLVDSIRTISFRVDSVYLIATPHEGIYPVIEQPTTG